MVSLKRWRTTDGRPIRQLLGPLVRPQRGRMVKMSVAAIVGGFAEAGQKGPHSVLSRFVRVRKKDFQRFLHARIAASGSKHRHEAFDIAVRFGN